MNNPPLDQKNSDLINPRVDEVMNWEKLIEHLRSDFDDKLSPEVEVLQFSGGHANLTYCLRFKDRELVLRRPPLGPVAKGAHDMGREYDILSKLYRGYDRAPQAYYYCADQTVLGAPFFVSERRVGVVARRQWPSELSDLPSVERRTSFALIDALADLHQINPTSLGLEELGRPTGFVTRQLTGWAKRWNAAKDRHLPLFDEVHAKLESTKPENTQISILHNDFKMDNCQFRTDDPDRVYSVFDWDMATLGDPLVDLGTLLNYWPKEGNIYAWDRNPPVVSEPYPKRAELTARYARKTGFNTDRITWYEAFARWKTAVVVQQIYIRFKRGQTLDNRFSNYGQYTEPLIQSAAQMLEQS